jgi:hypothetical protein
MARDRDGGCDEGSWPIESKLALCFCTSWGAHFSPVLREVGAERSPSIVRRDGRVAEGARLESVFRGNSNVGSNPTLSAMFLPHKHWRLPKIGSPEYVFWSGIGDDESITKNWAKYYIFTALQGRQDSQRWAYDESQTPPHVCRGPVGERRPA